MKLLLGYRPSTLKHSIITGDFNHVSLSLCLNGFVHYVDCSTRGDRTLDLFFLLNQKKRVFPNGDDEKWRSVQQEFKTILCRAKVEYKNKVEKQLENNNTSEV